MTMNRHTFDEVRRLDDALYQLALYDVTGGKLIIPKNIEHMMDLQAKTAHRFNEFKRLIQRGECTMEFIKWSVLDKYGPFPQGKDIDIDSEEFNRKLQEWEDDERRLKEEEHNGTDSLIKKMMSSLLSGNAEIKKNDIISPDSKQLSQNLPPKNTPKSITKNNKKKRK